MQITKDSKHSHKLVGSKLVTAIITAIIIIVIAIITAVTTEVIAVVEITTKVNIARLD